MDPLRRKNRAAFLRARHWSTKGCAAGRIGCWRTTPRSATRSAWRSACGRAIWCTARRSSWISMTPRCRARCRAPRPWSTSRGIYPMPQRRGPGVGARTDFRPRARARGTLAISRNRAGRFAGDPGRISLRARGISGRREPAHPDTGACRRSPAPRWMPRYRGLQNRESRRCCARCPRTRAAI